MTQRLAHPDAIDLTTFTDEQLAEDVAYARRMAANFRNMINVYGETCGWDDAVAEYEAGAEATQREIDYRKGLTSTR